MLQSQRPFINRALNACYPPASLFKLVTLSAAFETQLINDETTTYCRGFSKFHGRKYHCNNKLGHGALTITQAVALSCNPIFYEIGKKISIDTLADYAHKFGLGSKTGILLPESAGIIPSSQWKLKNKKERWWAGETLSAVIGQSYLNVTPIQIARMISSIFQGYLVKPRILENEPVTIEPLCIQKKTREFLKTAMEAVIHEGNAKALSKIKNVQLYAKTGTAQVLSFEKKGENDSAAFDEHAWIAVHMQYADQAPLMIIILLEHAKSSKVAIRIAKNVILAYKQHIDSEKIVYSNAMA
jgi:penicillin-binding protein 2